MVQKRYILFYMGFLPRNSHRMNYTPFETLITTLSAFCHIMLTYKIGFLAAPLTNIAQAQQRVSNSYSWLGKSTVYVWRQKEGYMVKYGLSPREIQMAQPIFYRICWLEFLYGYYPIPNNDILSFCVFDIFYSLIWVFECNSLSSS